jgi:hypothetical protein
MLVAVGSAARQLSGERCSAVWPVKSVSEAISPLEDVRIARFAPEGASPPCGFVWSDDRQVVVHVDGYLYTYSAPRQASRADQVKAFADMCRKDGYEAAIRDIAGGTFNLAVVDLARSRCHVTTDHIGSLTLYHSRVDGGWLLSTNPVALARSGIIDCAPDFTAMAEWAYIGYTIGDRFLLKGIRVVPPFTSFYWDSGKGQGHFGENADSPWRILPEDPGPSPDALTDAFLESCRRIVILEPRPAHFQSAGKDSRFILASWPEGYDPPCYTYGDGDSHEVEIAHRVAELRGSPWVHVWLDGDDVAPDLGELFDRTGQIVFPDRYLAARRIRRDGYAGVLDGYLGGVLNGAGYLDCDRYFSRLSRLMRYLTVYVDQKVSGIGRDRIAEAILDSILEVRDDAGLGEYTNGDFLSRLRAEWPDMLNDLRLQVDRFTPANDSLASLWNNLVLANRSAHAIVQQMVIVRSFVDVYCPFSGDLDLLRMKWRIPPGAAAHDRFYIRMYRRRFPHYGKIRNNNTLLPLDRPPLLHKWSAILMSKGISIPYVTGDAEGRERDANSWNRWLRQSRSMRDAALAFLREGGILDEESGSRMMDAVGTGARKGLGKVFHLAGISKWLGLSANGSRCGVFR